MHEAHQNGAGDEEFNWDRYELGKVPEEFRIMFKEYCGREHVECREFGWEQDVHRYENQEIMLLSLLSAMTQLHTWNVSLSTRPVETLVIPGGATSYFRLCLQTTSVSLPAHQPSMNRFPSPIPGVSRSLR